MRLRLLAPVVALLVSPAAASAQVQAPDESQATAPPVAVSPGAAGGAEYGAAFRPLHVSSFAVTPGTVVTGAPVTVSLRVEGTRPKARMRVALVRSGARRASATLNLGWRKTGVTIVRRWKPRKPLTAGSYVARVHAVDGSGRTLKRTASASGKQPIVVR